MLYPSEKGGLIAVVEGRAISHPRREVQGTPGTTIADDARNIQRLRLMMRKVHIRRPTTSSSFCGTVSAFRIVEMEDRCDSTCEDCRSEFGAIMYNGRFQ